jgi:hypothetical protein
MHTIVLVLEVGTMQIVEGARVLNDDDTIAAGMVW